MVSQQTATQVFPVNIAKFFRTPPVAASDVMMHFTVFTDWLSYHILMYHKVETFITFS